MTDRTRLILCLRIFSKALQYVLRLAHFQEIDVL